MLCTGSLAILVLIWAVFQRLQNQHLWLASNCVSFGICSWGMNVLNKSLAEAYPNGTCFVTAAQMIITIIGIALFRWHKFKGGEKQVKTWLLVPVLYFGMLVSSLFTFKYLTLSVLMVIRNLTPLIV